MIEEFLTGVPSVAIPDRVLSTVLFTDIVGSTARAAVLGDRSWRQLLDRHDATIEQTVLRYRGRLVKFTGDGILATFDGPGRALGCALTAMDVLAGEGIEIRSGVHTGEIELRGDDIGGMAVHIASRIAARADAGQVLVSSTVRDLVVGSDFVFDDLGPVSLKGVPDDWRLHAARPRIGSSAQRG